uniref:Phospholipase A2 group III n=1 Tax=Calidris pygmaea TaxID=425635 RepID=A0A8C3JR35_9CHAR
MTTADGISARAQAPPLLAQQCPECCGSAGTAGRASPWRLSLALALPAALSHVSSTRRRSARCCLSGQPAQGQTHAPASQTPASPCQQGSSHLLRQWGALHCGATRATDGPPYPPLSSRQNQTGSPHRLPPAGLFRGPDRCCREHDQCSAQITALQFNYGIRNYRLHTVSHCDCDARFRQCLLALNDTISNIIGVTFFNLLEVPCFVLEESEECVQWHWWGGCERYGVVPLARMVQQNQYHYSLPTQEAGSSAVRPPGKGKKAGGSAHPACTQDGNIRSSLAPESCGATPLPDMEVHRQHGESVLGAEHALLLGCPKASAQWGCVLAGPLTTPLSSGPRRVCRYYKHLDKCEHHIAPNEVKYQLHNTGTQMLFHCNCTRRCMLARSLHRVRNLSDVEMAVLADHITTDCFVLEPPADCSPGKGPQHKRDSLVGLGAVLQAWREAGSASIITCAAVS